MFGKVIWEVASACSFIPESVYWLCTKCVVCVLSTFTTIAQGHEDLMKKLSRPRQLFRAPLASIFIQTS
jgi:hypothetical protein